MTLLTEADYSQFSPEDQKLMATRAFGKEVFAFTESLVGRYLLERALAERAQALEQLAEVAASDTEAVRELQSTVRRCDSFPDWLHDAVMAGWNAHAVLNA